MTSSEKPRITPAKDVNLYFEFGRARIFTRLSCSFGLTVGEVLNRGT
ncbi:hypothetical protein [Streptosporangium sp. CA-115845]